LPFGLFLAPTIWLVWLLQITILEPPTLAGAVYGGPGPWATVIDNHQ